MIHDSSSNSSDTHYDSHIDSGLTTRIIEELIAQSELSGDDLMPLYQSIDPDALETLFAPQADGSERADGRVTFTHAGHVVTVSSDGTVDVTTADNQSE